MKKGLGIRVGIEVSGLPPEHEVGDEPRAAGDVLSEPAVLAWKEEEPAAEMAGEENEKERRKNAPEAARVKGEKSKGVLVLRPQNDLRDEEAGDDEEDIDTDEAASTPAGEGMKADHRQDCDGPEAIDVAAVGEMQGLVGQNIFAVSRPRRERVEPS